jgi:cytochrome c oxidase assembly protein subunit 15
LSNGSLNPQGWLSNLAMFAEHSHRLSAGMMSIITLSIAVWIWRVDGRSWLKKMAAFSVVLVFAQAVVGGLRVLLEHHNVAMIDTSVGRLFAMLHACLAQIFVCTLVGIATACSRSWIEGQAGIRGTVSPGLRRLSLICCSLLLVQLAVAAVMRHSFAGLAIPTFPYSAPQGGLLPLQWDFRVGINFTHRVIAGTIAVMLIVLAVKMNRDRAVLPSLRWLGVALVGLLWVQIYLGASVIWTGRDPYLTTGHVIVGAITLATTFFITWLLHRDVIERASSDFDPSNAASTQARSSHFART